MGSGMLKYLRLIARPGLSLAVFYWEDATIAVSLMVVKALNNGFGRITLRISPYLTNGFTAEVALGNLSGSPPTRLRRSIILDGVTKRPLYSVAALFQDFDMLYVCLPPEKPQRLVGDVFTSPSHGFLRKHHAGNKISRSFPQ